MIILQAKLNIITDLVKKKLFQNSFENIILVLIWPLEIQSQIFLY